MREEIRDIERLEHMLEAMNVLVSYKETHTLEEAQADPVVYYGLVKNFSLSNKKLLKNLVSN